jgi:lipopolysaccharide/colanic/teichoic acid biosynthesis glycosyltransferase
MINIVTGMHLNKSASIVTALKQHLPVNSFDDNYRLLRFVEILFASTCLLFSAPLFLVLAIAIPLLDGGDIFFRAARMGKNRRLFYMWKFRTLKVGSDRKTAGQVLALQQQLETPIGRFLRETRLDEIPQFINVIKGEMGVFGPRPVRPEVYEAQCRMITGYDKRFMVRPGLLGYSQLFTPHNTPKRMRSLLDNRFLSRSHSFINTFSLVIISFMMLGGLALKKLVLGGRRILTQYFYCGHTHNQRVLQRIYPKGVSVSLVDSQNLSASNKDQWILEDINEDFLSLYSQIDPGEAACLFRLAITGTEGEEARRVKCKSAYLEGRVAKRRKIRSDEGLVIGYELLLNYQAVSPFNRYLIDKYYIGKSIL